MSRTIAFVVDLVQDVNILRPIILFARAVPGNEIIVLASKQFSGRDSTGLWAGELRDLCGPLQIPIITFASDIDAVCCLQSRRGILIAASESTVENHAISHSLFRSAPSSFVKATLQHGFECVGFLHNEGHNRSYGRYVGFAADIVCGWFGEDRLSSVAPDQRSKIFVTGPPLLLDPPSNPTLESSSGDLSRRSFDCLICENLHSVRLGGVGLRDEFLLEFDAFATDALARGINVWLRPHPAGRYTTTRNVQLPTGVRLSEGPLYKERIDRYQFSVSAPSSVLFDLMIRNVPVAVWQDTDGRVDCRNYDGLTIVSSSEDWRSFASEVLVDPAPTLRAQQEFIRKLQIPEDVPSRFRQLLCAFG